MIEICCGVACFLDFPFLFSFVFLCVFLCHLSVNNAALIIYTTVSSILCGFSRWRSATTTAVNMILIIPSKAPTPFPASPITWSRDDDVTSVAVATTGNHTVAFVGFGSGQIKKVSSSIATPAVNNWFHKTWPERVSRYNNAVREFYDSYTLFIALKMTDYLVLRKLDLFLLAIGDYQLPSVGPMTNPSDTTECVSIAKGRVVLCLRRAVFVQFLFVCRSHCASSSQYRSSFLTDPGK